MKQQLRLVLLIIFLSVSLLNAANITVDDDGPADYATIQAALIAASNGDVINVAPGTYSTGGATLTINKEVLLIGADEATTFIDASLNGTSWGIRISASNVTLRNFTILPGTVPINLGTSSGGGFPLHANNVPSEITNLTVENITVANSNRTGLDFHGVTGLTLNNITSEGAAYGNGIQFSGCLNVIATNLSTANNTWGSVAIYSSQAAYMNRGSDNILIDATSSSFGEYSTLGWGIYNENEFGLFNTNISVTGYNATLQNSASPNYTWYYETVEDAAIAANASSSPETSSIKYIDSGDGYVVQGMSIQEAINSASASGDEIFITAGTYNEKLNLLGKTLTLSGSGNTSTIIDASGTSGYAIENFGDSVTIQDLKLTNAQHYGFKISSVNDIILTNIIAENGLKTGVDLLGVTNAMLTNVQSLNNGGHGISLTDCNGVNLSGITVQGNSWQGISIATWGRYSSLGTSGIVFSGSNTFTDVVQIEMGDYNNPGVAPAGDAVITYSTEFEDGADVTVQASELAYAVHGDQDDSPDQVRIFLVQTQTEAEDVVATAPSHFTGAGMYIENLVNTNELIVTPGGSIEAAANSASNGDVITVLPGTYNGFVITKSITLVGGSGVVINNGTPTPSPSNVKNSTITAGSPAITIVADNVVIDEVTFTFDAADFAIAVSGVHSGIVVKNCTFSNINGASVGNAIDNNGGAGPDYVLANENNAWSGTGGPTHASNPIGTGNIISDYVIYDSIELVSPVTSVTGVSIKPELTWDNNGAAGYKIQIATSTDFVTDLVVEHSVGAGINSYRFSGYNHPEIPLNNNTKYYWRVIAEYGGIEHTTSAWYFTTISDVNISLWNPGNGAELYLYDPAIFTWGLNQATGSLKFYLQLFEQGIAPNYVQIASFELTNAQNFGPNSAFYFENMNEIYRTINGLSGGSKYYWYICAYIDDGSTPNVLDLDDRIVKYSPLFNFTTKGGAVKAYPSWPVGGNTIYDLQPSFYWYTMTYEPSATYEVLYSTSSSVGGSGELNSGVTTISAGNNTYVGVGTTLDASTTYYWQIKTSYGSSVNYSSVTSFTTYDAPGIVPTPAIPSYPTGGLEIYTTAPTFYWYIQGYNVDVNFSVELSTDGGTTWPITFGTTTNTYLQVSGLTAGQSYLWRVKSEKSGYTTVYSSTAAFSVTGGLSSYPVVSWPVGNPTVYSATPTLSWYMEGSTLGWTHYKVAWSKVDKTPAEWLTFITSGANPDSVYVTSNMYETSYTFTSALDYGSKYYWAVTAHDHPSGPYSDVAEGSFTIAGNNATIVQLNPSNNEVVYSKSPPFTWHVSGSILGVTHYRLTYSKNELFNANVETVVTTTTSASVNAPLENGTTYWWYVELSYDSGSTWENASSTWKFTVDPGASSVVPFAGSPARGITISSTSPVLSWYLPAQSTSALSYDLEIADNADFTNAIVFKDINKMNAAVEKLSDGEYFWRVKSKTANNESDYSAATSFKIGTVTEVNDEEELPLTYSIEQNYPNPFNPTTTIRYSIPSSSYVSIKIYDMLGQEVKSLVNQEMKAGKHTLNWNGANNYGYKVSSGTYIYRITAGEFVQSKKMILLK